MDNLQFTYDNSFLTYFLVDRNSRIKISHGFSSWCFETV